MLRGELVTLRPLRPTDYARLAETGQDVEMLSLAGAPVRPYTADDIKELFDRLLKDPHAVVFAIEYDDVLVGEVLLRKISQISATAEVAIAIEDRAYWGKGLGRDALRLTVDYAARFLNLRKLWLVVHANNPRAFRAYQAVGFIEEGRQFRHDWVDGQYVDLVYMALFLSDNPRVQPAAQEA